MFLPHRLPSPFYPVPINLLSPALVDLRQEPVTAILHRIG